jgi:5-methylcytosine-specific restriction endonuclease McrA
MKAAALRRRGYIIPRVGWGAGFMIACAVCGDEVPADGTDFDHVRARCFDGEDHYRNLRPICTPCHKKKTKADMRALAKAKRLERKRLGLTPEKRSRKIASRGFDRRLTRGVDGTTRDRTGAST